MEKELLGELEEELSRYVKESEMNYVSESMALRKEDIGKRLYDSPILCVGSASDPMWEEMKRSEAVGELFRTPKEWKEWAETVVSYFAPFSDWVVEGNRKERVDVGNGWLYARVEGQAFLTALNHHIESWLEGKGVKAFSPYSSPEFRYVFEPGTNDQIKNRSLGFTSNWSERHVAYVCGMGTFGLSKGLITKRGVSGRYGSVITSCRFPVTERDYGGIYDYCTMCGKCAENCPAGAISLEKGKDHHICCSYFDTLREKYAPRFGCGKCQVNTPCERSIPAGCNKKEHKTL